MVWGEGFSGRGGGLVQKRSGANSSSRRAAIGSPKLLTRIERAGLPLLHTTVDLGPGSPSWLPPVAPRAYVSTVHIGEQGEVAVGEDAVRLPLPGGWVTAAWGDELHRVAVA